MRNPALEGLIPPCERGIKDLGETAQSSGLCVYIVKNLLPVWEQDIVSK